MAFRARLDSTLGLPGLPGGGQAGAKQPFQPPPPAPFGQLSGPAETVALAGLQAEGSEDLITPANAEAGPAALNPLAAVPATATAWALAGGRPPAPPPPQQCLLCGGLGSSSLCGVLKPAIFEGRAEAVHHLCALWAPGCFQREVGAGCCRPGALACRPAANPCLLAADSALNPPTTHPHRDPPCTSTWRRRRGAPAPAPAPPAARPARPWSARNPGEAPQHPGHRPAPQATSPHKDLVLCPNDSHILQRSPTPQVPRCVPPAVRRRRAGRGAGGRDVRGVVRCARGQRQQRRGLLIPRSPPPPPDGCAAAGGRGGGEGLGAGAGAGAPSSPARPRPTHESCPAHPLPCLPASQVAVAVRASAHAPLLMCSAHAPTGRSVTTTPGSRWCRPGGASTAPCTSPVSWLGL